MLSTSKRETKSCKQEDEKPLTSLFNAAFHEGTFQNCNFHIVNNFSRIIDCMVIEVATVVIRL